MERNLMTRQDQIEALRHAMRVIRDHAKWGINGTPDYRLDRLKQIEAVVDAVLKD